MSKGSTNDRKREQVAKPNAGVPRVDEESKRKKKLAFDEKKQSEKVQQKYSRNK